VVHLDLCVMGVSVMFSTSLIHWLLLLFFFWSSPPPPQPQLLQQHIKNKRPQVKNVATQKETSATGPDSRSKIVLLVDASQQTGKAVFCLFTYLSALMCGEMCVEQQCPLLLSFLRIEPRP
jgi:hypothetical protein